MWTICFSLRWSLILAFLLSWPLEQIAHAVPDTVKLINPTVSAGAALGISVASIGSQHVLVGAWMDDTGTTNAGVACIFQTNGTLKLTITNPVPTKDANFGWSVAALDSERLLIGAPRANSGAVGAGAAYLITTGGVLITTFTNPSPAANDNFGWTVAGIGNDRVAIGAWQDSAGGPKAGAVYVIGTNGTLLATCLAPNNGGGLGTSLTILGHDRILAGAPFVDLDLAVPNVGAAYLFDTNGTMLTTFTNPTPVAYEEFAAGIGALGPDRIIIGSRLDAHSGMQAGIAYLFNLQGTLLTTFTNPTPDHLDNFGWSMSGVGSNWVLISAPSDDTGGANAGAAYLFNTNGIPLCVLAKESPAPGDFFGHAVSILGQQRLVIGAWGDDTSATNAGAAYIIDVPTPPLRIRQSNSNMDVWWMSDEPDLILLWSESFDPLSPWTAAPEPVTVTGNRRTVTQNVTATNRFYRLVRP